MKTNAYYGLMIQLYISKAKTSSFQNIPLNDHSAEILCVICVSVVKFLK